MLQSNDRVPSAHSTASSYDHYNAKHERDQRPHSSHSRDDDRGSTKDSSQTPTRLWVKWNLGFCEAHVTREITDMFNKLILLPLGDPDNQTCSLPVCFGGVRRGWCFIRNFSHVQLWHKEKKIIDFHCCFCGCNLRKEQKQTKPKMGGGGGLMSVCGRGALSVCV